MPVQINASFYINMNIVKLSDVRSVSFRMHVEHGVRLELANLFERFKGGLSHISILGSRIHNLLIRSFLQLIRVLVGQTNSLIA